jgi:hypothetical protein
MVYTIIQTAKSMPKEPKTKLSLVKWSVFYQKSSVIQINSILINKKRQISQGEEICLYRFTPL